MRMGTGQPRSDSGGDRAFRALCLAAAGVVVLILATVIVSMLVAAWPALVRFGVRFLVGTAWDPVTEEYGALPAIWGTLYSSWLAILLAVPVGLGAAIYLTEMAPRWLREPAMRVIELLAAIPSVVYGLWAIFVVVPLIRALEAPLGAYLGFLPLFQGPPFGFGMLAAGVILAIMILPTITAIAREVLQAVPRDQREAALALGATRWEAIWTVVLRNGRSGLAGAVILALGRALGETMAVTMVIGNQPVLSLSLFMPGETLASVIANQFAEATSPLYIAALMELGLVLFGITFLLNVVARALVARIEARGVRREVA